MGVHMFYLKLYDRTLIKFDIKTDLLDGQSCHICYVNKEYDYLFPIGMDVNDDGLMS